MGGSVAPSPSAYPHHPYLPTILPPLRPPSNSSASSPSTTTTPQPQGKDKGKQRSNTRSFQALGVTARKADGWDGLKCCEAIDRWEERCERVVRVVLNGTSEEDGVEDKKRFCEVHEKELEVVKKEFERCLSSPTFLLPPFPTAVHLRTHTSLSSLLSSTTSLSELESYEKTMREGIDLVDKAVKCRDWCWKHFDVGLKDCRGEKEGGLLRRPREMGRGRAEYEKERCAILKQTEEWRRSIRNMEGIAHTIILRSHSIILSSEDASWLLHPAQPSPIPPHHHHHHHSQPPLNADQCTKDCMNYTNPRDVTREGEPTVLSGTGPPTATETLTNTNGTTPTPPVTIPKKSPPDSYGPTKSPPLTISSSFIPPPPSRSLPPILSLESVDPDPIAALEKARRSQILELLSLTGSHASFIRDNSRSVERVRVVECLFRRLISRDPVLLVRAYRSGHDHVLRFFENPAWLPLPLLSSLYSRLLSTGPRELKEAITDAFRAIRWEESGSRETEEGDEGRGLQILGGWIYMVEEKEKVELPNPTGAGKGGMVWRRGEKGKEMGMKEWGHLYDLCACPHCALSLSSTFTEFTRLLRLSTIPKAPFPLWNLSRHKDETDAMKVLKALEIVVGARSGRKDIGRIPSGWVRWKEGFGGAGPGEKEVWKERQERNWCVLKISLNNPSIVPLLTSLSTLHTCLIRPVLSITKSTAPKGNAPAWTPPPSFPLPPKEMLWRFRWRYAPNPANFDAPPLKTDDAEAAKDRVWAKGTKGTSIWLTNDDTFITSFEAMNKLKLDYYHEVQRCLECNPPSTPSSSLQYVNDRPMEEKWTDVYEVLILDSNSDPTASSPPPPPPSTQHHSGPTITSGFTFDTYSYRSYNAFEKELADIVVSAVFSGKKVSHEQVLLFCQEEARRAGEVRIRSRGKGAKEGWEKSKDRLGMLGKEGKAAKMLEALRDDSLAFRLSRSLFR